MSVDHAYKTTRPHPDIAPVLDTTPATTSAVDAATTAIRHTATRLNAPDPDLTQVLAALFAPTESQLIRPPSRINEGTPLSPTDKQLITEGLTAGLDASVVAEQVGCSIQAVAGVRTAMRNHARHRKQATT